MDTPELPSLTEKHNAMVSYCFLAPFMLMSRQKQFSNKFVRSHARYATLLHIGFLILIISLIRSRNFASVIIYDMTWVHGVLFILFFGLLFLLGNGLYSALKGNKPRISLSSLSLKSFEKEFSDEVAVEKDEKTTIILSHIPFLGIYLATKYGGKLSQGEKFGTWLYIAIILATVIDPSLTLAITIIILAIFWIVYQSIGTANTTTVHLIGNRLWDARDVHIYTKSIILYSQALLKHEQKIPSWTEIYETTRNNYGDSKSQNYSPFLYLPVINIVLLFRLRNNEELKLYAIQGLLITILALYGLLGSSIAAFMIALLGGFWGYVQVLFQKNANIPIIGECAEMIIAFLEWRKKRSAPEKVSLITSVKS